MTNLLAVIFFTVSTNWVTVKEEKFPVNTGAYHYQGSTLTQVGIITSNECAVIEWRGSDTVVNLREVPLGSTEREITLLEYTFEEAGRR